jgi:hypothetical protein
VPTWMMIERLDRVGTARRRKFFPR